MESGKVFKTEKYYFFWGICTVAVVLGQVYVGSGYRQMSNSIFTAIETWTQKHNNETSLKPSAMLNNFKLIETENEEGYYKNNLKK